MVNNIGWGQGAINNDIHWGHSNDNQIGYGAIYIYSLTDETVINTNEIQE